MKGILKEHILPAFMILIGAACAAFSLECFLIPNTILDGGVTGIWESAFCLTGSCPWPRLRYSLSCSAPYRR